MMPGGLSSKPRAPKKPVLGAPKRPSRTSAKECASSEPEILLLSLIHSLAIALNSLVFSKWG